MSAVLGSIGMPGEDPSASPATSAAAAVPPLHAKSDPTTRLADSRRQLRDAMMHIAHPPALAAGTATGAASRAAASVLGALRSLPGASGLWSTVESWWAAHPLRGAAYLTGQASRAMLKPIARKHPLKLVLGASLFGALIVALRPWRWLLRSAVLAGLIPQIARIAVRQVPLTAWLRMFKGLQRSATAAPVTPVEPMTQRRTTPPL
jgi:hypothetical protein